MLLALQLACAFLLGIGFIFTLIDLRTRFGPLFRNFSICLLFFPTVAFLDLLSYADYVPPDAKLLLQRSMHLLVLPFMPFSIAYLRKIAGRRPGLAPLIFSLIAILLAPIELTEGFLRLQGNEVRGGPWYVWTFLPFGIAYVLTAYAVMIGHLRSVSAGEKSFPAMHLLGFVFATSGGIADMLGMANPRLHIFESFKSVGIVIFGIFCACFFAQRFFLLLKERDELFRRVEGLNREFQDSQPIRKLGESAAFISHEIGNYFSILRSNQILLRQKLAVPLESREMDRIGRNTERLEVFVRSLLDYSNVAMPRRMVPISLARVIEECLELHFTEARGSIDFAAHAESPDFHGDPILLERAFLNVIRNSLEAGATRIRIVATAGPGEARLDIEDDGVGCPLEDLAKVGTPFFTTKKGKGGSGLGMALVSSIVAVHQGSIQLLPGKPNGKGGHGMRILFTFPAPSQRDPAA
jgi:signal transduction histidine kinase